MKKKPYQSSPLVTGTLTRSRTYIVVPRDVPPENFLTVSETRKVGQGIKSNMRGTGID